MHLGLGLVFVNNLPGFYDNSIELGDSPPGGLRVQFDTDGCITTAGYRLV